MKTWVLFKNKKTGESLYKVSYEGSHEGEIKSTKGLLAYENGIEEEDIEVEVLE